MPAPSSAAAATNSIQLELQQLRGDLFDISDADSSIALILNKVQQLSEHENKVVEEQQQEIERLRSELKFQKESRTSAARVVTAAENDDDEVSRIDGLESVPSFGSITMDSSSSQCFTFTSASEMPFSYSLHSNEQLAQKANLSQNIASLQADITAAINELDELRSLKTKTADELHELNVSKDRVEEEIANLKEQIQLLLQERTKLIQEVEVYNDQAEIAYELEEAQEANARLTRQVEMLKEGSERAEEYITRTVQENKVMERQFESLRERAETAEMSAKQVKEQAVRQWEQAIGEKELAEKKMRSMQDADERAEKESLIRQELTKEMEILYEEKIACEKELADLKFGTVHNSKAVGRKLSVSTTNMNDAIVHEADIRCLKHEIQTLWGENESLRSTAKRDSEKIADLNDEIRSLLSEGEAPPVSTPMAVTYRGGAASPFATSVNDNGVTPVTNNTASSLTAASRKRQLMLSQGSVGEDDRREYKRSISYDPRLESQTPNRERLDSTGSGSLEQISHIGSMSLEETTEKSRDRTDTCGSDTISALHEADNVSLLFGQESASGKNGSKSNSNGGEEEDDKSNHEDIRAHAEKLLYWANKAEERSVASSKKNKQLQEQASQSQQLQDTIAPQVLYASPIPKTIGLPPRSQSKVRSSSKLPPRCPPAPSSTVQDTLSDGSSTISDKENGGATFNETGAFPSSPVPGAFPSPHDNKSLSSASKPKKNVSLSENDTIIHNLDYMNDAPVLCCECSTSPFSGNDPQSEFYLPKLGMACTCGMNSSSVIDDRVSFSENPTALSSILRPWQCDFLSTLGVTHADELLKAHKADANGMARSMKKWRSKQRNMGSGRSKECYVALKIWSRTCKIVLRSIREQKEMARQRSIVEGGGDADEEDVVIEKPDFLDITFADTHTLASISTLGQLSSVGGGGRPFEMMEI